MAFHNVPPNGFPDLPDVEELEAVQKDVKNLKTTTAEQGAAITNLNTEKATKTDIATEFSDLTNYNAGDLVYYDGALYEFQVDHTAGAWETSEVIQKDLSDIITTLKSGLTNIQNQSGEVASGIIDGNGSVDIQLPIGVGAYLLCTYRDNDYFAGLYYLTYMVGDRIASSPILTNTSITVTDNLSDRHITIANSASYPCCYAIKNLAHGY